MSLTPMMAAGLANGVYGIIDRDNAVDGFEARSMADATLVSSEFDLGSARVVQGVTGGRSFSQSSGFAAVVPGTGSRSNEAAVTIRGTVTGYDWLTNVSAAVGRGPGRQVVHAGFNRTATSILDATRAAIQEFAPSHIHVTGHSLGGAVANLIAAHLQNQAGPTVELYTFGAPRAGLDNFSTSLTRNIAMPIRRVYNPSDIVPMVPIFPFKHAPRPGSGIAVRTDHAMLSINAHFMSAYGPAVKDKSWSGLVAASGQSERQLGVDQWLHFAADHSVIPGSSIALHALGYALRGIVDVATAKFGLALTGGLTLIDGLSWILAQGARLSKAIASQVGSLIGTVLRFAGSAISAAGNLTINFIRYVIGLLLRPLAAIAQRAFSRIEQGAN
jgi:triacylglycerol lipase